MRRSKGDWLIPVKVVACLLEPDPLPWSSLNGKSMLIKEGAGMWQAIKSVLAAFLGVQKDSRRRADFASKRPGTFIAAGLIVGVVFVVLVAAVAMLAAR